MEDFVKVQLCGIDPAELARRKGMQFYLDGVSEETGEIKPGAMNVAYFGPELSGWNGSQRPRVMRLRITPTHMILLDGSIHKYAQNGKNWDQFTMPELLKAIEDLADVTGCLPDQMKVFKLEWGVNFLPPVGTKEMIDCFVCHRAGDRFKGMSGSSASSPGLVLKRKHYIIKIYDKGGQYGLPDQVMRVEIQILDRSILIPLRVKTMADLLIPQVRANLTTYCLKILDQLFISEPKLDRLDVPESDREFMALTRDPSYWQTLGRQPRLVAKARYKRLITMHVEQPVVDVLRESIKTAFTASAALSVGDVLEQHMKVQNVTKGAF